MTKAHIRPFVYVLIWLIILSVLSSDFFSYYATRKLVKDIMLYFDPEVSIRTILKTHSFLRKALHVVNYAILSYFILCAVTKSTRPLLKWTTAYGLLAFLCCVIISLVDELRQSLSAIRTPMLFDVFLDSSGAFLTQLMCMIISGWKD